MINNWIVLIIRTALVNAVEVVFSVQFETGSTSSFEIDFQIINEHATLCHSLLFWASFNSVGFEFNS